MDGDERTTELLRRWREGDEQAAEELLPLVHDQLYRLARRSMRGEKASHTLQPTALVNEVWMRLAGSGGQARDRAHFIQLAAKSMRSILIDHARRRRAEKRGGGRLNVTLQTGLMESDGAPLDYLDLEGALVALGEVDGQLTRIVELRFFGGLTAEETATILQVSERTVERGWRTARAFLAQQLENGTSN